MIDLLLFGSIVCAFCLGWIARGQARARRLPPATRRQIDRARRAASADLRFSADHIAPANVNFDSRETM